MTYEDIISIVGLLIKDKLAEKIAFDVMGKLFIRPDFRYSRAHRSVQLSLNNF